MKTTLIPIVAALAVAACIARRPADPGTPIREARPRVRAAAQTAVVRAEPAPSAKESFWIRIKGPDPIRRTAEHLGIQRADEFVTAAGDAVRMLKEAQERRQRALASPDAGIRISIEADGSFQSDRQAALDRIEPFLDDRDQHREFRDQIDTWAATIWAASQGVYRSK